MPFDFLLEAHLRKENNAPLHFPVTTNRHSSFPSTTRSQNLLNCFTALPVFGITLITLNRTYSRSKVSHVVMLANLIWSSLATYNKTLPAKI